MKENRPRREAALCAAAILVICLLVHQKALSGFFLADDYTILGSFWGKGASHLLGLLVSDEIGGVWKEQFLRPLRPWSLAIDGWLWGLEPLGFHLTTLLLHAVTACLIAVLVHQLGGRVTAGGVAALLFLLHPLNVEVAAWISGRDESLSAALLLGALVFYFEPQRAERRRLGTAVSLALFALSLFSKEYGLLLPFALAAGVFAFPSEEHRLPVRLRQSLPVLSAYLGVVAFFLAVRWIAIGDPLGGYGPSAGAHTRLSLDLLRQDLTGFVRQLIEPGALAGAVLMAAIALVAVRGLATGSRAWAAIGFWTVLWPLLFLLPTHNLVYTPRHLYLSFAGIAIGVGLALSELGWRFRYAVDGALAAGLIAILAPPTRSREQEFARMSDRCHTALASIDRYERTFPSGDVLVLVGMPAHHSSPWGFGWSLYDALRPPFVSEPVVSRLEIVTRRQWRMGAWESFQRKYPGRGIHVLAWNPDSGRIETIDSDHPDR